MKPYLYGVGGAVVTAIHASVKETFRQIFQDQVGFIPYQFEDGHRTGESTHRGSHALFMVDFYRSPAALKLHLSLLQIGEGVPQFHLLGPVGFLPHFPFMLFPASPVMPVH